MDFAGILTILKNNTLKDINGGFYGMNEFPKLYIFQILFINSCFGGWTVEGHQDQLRLTGSHPHSGWEWMALQPGRPELMPAHSVVQHCVLMP